MPACQRDSFIELLWQQVRETLYITREQFVRSMEGYEIDPIYNEDGALAFLFVVKGPEFHFSTFGTGRQADRAILRKYPGSLIEQYGYALTRTPKEDVRQQRFNKIVGFFPTGEDEHFIHYRIERLRHA